MLILATDTSGKNGSIALVRCEKNSPRAIELVPLQGGTFSAHLIPQIAELLSKHGLGKSNVDAFAVATGPGSFTGLRVGLAAIKALAEILRKPIATVSLLEVIAAQTKGIPSEENRTVLTALDAGRNEIFVGQYKVGLDVPSCVAEYLLSFDELAEQVSRSPLPVYTPDNSVAQLFDAHRANSGQSNIIRVQRPDAVSVASLGWRKIRAGLTVSPEELDATYIRRADAEIKRPTHTPA
jgi:tRNA threonylcarbamoyladenosine biosynthesis protein TsaB